jgi:gliding motility-associated-like protein
LKQHNFLFLLLFLGVIQLTLSQNITISPNSFSDQELVEDVLFGTNCVNNIFVTNTVSGNFSNSSISYGYFNANNSDFPFSEGLVLSTGRLSNVPGPNNSLSDDDASGWNGDQDLENALGINNTINATIFEFSFVPQASSINFRYIFASEEYRENNSFTCDFSDAFAFLIRPVGGQYQNLALVPGTNIPVLVTTVRPEIPGECEAINEEYFGQFNTVDAPINFNGQTAILTAETDVIAGQAYEIKLVIADETNYRYDSAVFIEANSFNVGVDLGQNQNLCEGESTNLQIDNDEALAIRWFYESQLINDVDDNIDVSQADSGSGVYSVEVDLPSGCTAEDEVNIFFDTINLPDELSVTTCLDDAGFGVFNLFDVSSLIDNNLQVLAYYNTIEDAEAGINSISNPTNYENLSSSEIVYARILSPGNCIAAKEVLLLGSNNDLGDVFYTSCQTSDASVITFNVQDIKIFVSDQLGYEPQNLKLFESESNAVSQSEELNSEFYDIDSDLIPASIFARVDEGNECVGIAEVTLQQTESINFLDNTSEFLICENESVLLSASIENPNTSVVYNWSTGETTENISITEPGIYSVDVLSTQTIDGQDVVCTIFKEFTVNASSLPEVTYTQSGFVGIDNRLIINAEGSGDYEYALNNSGYVDSNTFSVEQTENTLFVRDKNGCGVVTIDFLALRIPDFFTPNGDGFNDYWQIKGIRQSENDVKTIYIFDRYGKLIFESSPLLIGWDGTYNGTPVPIQDYWYKIQLNSGKSITGHLTLKR